MSESTTLSYKDRVVRFYQAYAPENLSKVDTALERYVGQEQRLIEDLITKYGKPEPTDEQVRLGPSAAEGGGQPTSSEPPTQIGGTSPSMRRVASTPGGAPPRRPSVAGGSPRSRQGSVASPRGNASFASAGSTSPSTFPQAPPLQQQSTFGDVQVSDGDEDDDFGSPRPSAAAAAAPMDPYTSMRSKITRDVGFSETILKRIWEDAWLGKIPFGNLIKTWGDSIIHQGFGWKLTNASAIQRWQKRYFVLVPHFLYYFDSDDAKTPCKGAVYLERAKVKEQSIKERNAIVITPRVHKKPLELVADGDFSNFTVNFDPKKVQDVWFDLLSNMSKIVPTPSTPTTIVPGGVPESPGVTLKKAQSTVGSSSIAAARRAASTVSPMRLDRSSGGGYSAASQHNIPVGNDSLYTPAGAAPGHGYPSHMNLAQFTPASVSSFDRSPLYPLTPREAATLASADAAGAQLPPLPTPPRPNPFLAALEDPAVMTAHDASGATHDVSSMAATQPFQHQPQQQQQQQVVMPQAMSTSLADEHNRQLIQQQQKLQHMLVAAQQQQSDLLFRSQLQQEVTKARQTLHVDESDLKRRIGRIADDRDTHALAEALLSFVIDNVSDLNALWKLMSQLDDLPRKVQPPTTTPVPVSAPLPTHAQPLLDAAFQHHQQQHGVTTPRASPPPQQQFHYHHQQQPHYYPGAQQPQLLEDDIVSVSRASVAPHPPLTYDHITQQIAADQQHYREAEAVMQRQRILENQEIALRYQQQQQQFGVNGGLAGQSPSSSQTHFVHHSQSAVSAGATSPAGHLYSPSASAWPSHAQQHLQRAGSLGGYSAASNGNGAAASHQREDYAWQERLARMKQRKRAVEGLLNDLPA